MGMAQWLLWALQMLGEELRLRSPCQTGWRPAGMKVPHLELPGSQGAALRCICTDVQLLVKVKETQSLPTKILDPGLEVLFLVFTFFPPETSRFRTQPGS